VNQIKTAVETACPNTVSCADILALAAEISSVLVCSISSLFHFHFSSSSLQKQQYCNKKAVKR